MSVVDFCLMDGLDRLHLAAVLLVFLGAYLVGRRAERKHQEAQRRLWGEGRS